MGRMTPFQQRLALIAVRLGGRMAVRRVSRARSLRWAVGVHLVTLVVAALAVVAVAAIVAVPERPSRRRPVVGRPPAVPRTPALTSENHFHQ